MEQTAADHNRSTKGTRQPAQQQLIERIGRFVVGAVAAAGQHGQLRAGLQDLALARHLQWHQAVGCPPDQQQRLLQPGQQGAGGGARGSQSHGSVREKRYWQSLRAESYR
jgi:hypothetical protein